MPEASGCQLLSKPVPTSSMPGPCAIWENVAENVIDNGSPDLLVTIAMFSRTFSPSVCLSVYPTQFDRNAIDPFLSALRVYFLCMQMILAMRKTPSCAVTFPFFLRDEKKDGPNETLPHRIGFVITN